MFYLGDWSQTGAIEVIAAITRVPALNNNGRNFDRAQEWEPPPKPKTNSLILHRCSMIWCRLHKSFFISSPPSLFATAGLINLPGGRGCASNTIRKHLTRSAMRRTESLVLPGNITLRGIKQHSEQNSTEQMNWALAYSDGKACTSTRPISVTKETISLSAITATALVSLTGKETAKLAVSGCYSAIVLD